MGNYGILRKQNEGSMVSKLGDVNDNKSVYGWTDMFAVGYIM